MRNIRFVLFLIFFVFLNFFVKAEENMLRLAYNGVVQAADPHALTRKHPLALMQHLYDGLVAQDPMQNLKPGLALKWESKTPTSWEFTLREGVTFHDGSPVTAEDIKWSLERAKQGTETQVGMSSYVRMVESVEIIAPSLLRISTHIPYVFLPSDIANVAILKKMQGQHGVFVGSGPYKLKHWQNSLRVDLERNERYWGAKPAWKNVEIHFLPNDENRIRALKLGKVDVIAKVLHRDAVALKDKYALHHGMLSQLLYLALRAQDLKQADKNLTTEQVVSLRKAISMGIDRSKIAGLLLKGSAQPANQFVPADCIGHLSEHKLIFDPEKAKKNIENMGLVGIEIPIFGPINYYPSGVEIVQVVKSSLKSLGLEPTVHTMNSSLYFPTIAKRKPPIMQLAWPVNQDAIHMLKALVHSPDPEKGFGSFNRGGYSNHKVDDLIHQTFKNFDGKARERFTQRASELALDDMAIVPIVWLSETWSSRQGIKCTARRDGYMLAMNIQPI